MITLLLPNKSLNRGESPALFSPSTMNVIHRPTTACSRNYKSRTVAKSVDWANVKERLQAAQKKSSEL